MKSNAYIMLSKGNWRMIAVRMPEEDIEKLNRLAEKHRISREAFIRGCILEKFEKLEAIAMEY